MHVLILSANTGTGHNSTAQAIAEQFEKLNVDCEIADTLSFISERVSEFISWGHSYVYRKMPRLFGVGYRYEEKHPPRFIYERCAKGADALWERLKSKHYDAVICVHVFSGMMMTEVRARYHDLTPAFFVATDYTCSPGVSELNLDAYFIPHRMLLGEFLKNGTVPANKMFATGIPVRRTFYESQSKQEARRLLGLPEDGQIVLISCGSMGCGRLERATLMMLRHLPATAHLVVLCGHNEKLLHALTPHENESLHPIGFTDAVPSYMSAADVYLTKPGGLSTSEAIVRRVPMIFINAVPGLETRNFEFLISCGVASGAKSWRQAALITQKLLRKPSVAEKQTDAMKCFTQQNAAEQLCQEVIRQIKTSYNT